MTPQDDAARIQALIDEIAFDFGGDTPSPELRRLLANELVQVATAAAYRHAAAYCRSAGERTDFVTEHMALTKVAQICEGWAEKYEAQQEPKP